MAETIYMVQGFTAGKRGSLSAMDPLTFPNESQARSKQGGQVGRNMPGRSGMESDGGCRGRRLRRPRHAGAARASARASIKRKARGRGPLHFSWSDSCSYQVLRSLIFRNRYQISDRAKQSERSHSE